MLCSKLDVPVALIFFIRPESLRQVFERVKTARPSKLFLIQDGPRNNEDLIRIEQCRKIVEDIHWQCEVFTNYSQENLGCGVRPYTGLNWVFEHVDRAIILEDDCVPADTFFSFCAEMLERYHRDSRVGMIAGLNRSGEYDFGPYSYGFVKSGAGGWATWRDRWDKYDYYLRQVDNEYVMRLLNLDISPRFAAKNRIALWRKTKESVQSDGGVSYWDYQWSFVLHVNSWLTIVPRYNQITNVGIGTGATHSGNSLTALPKSIARLFFMKTEQIPFPLKHPDFVLPDRRYDSAYYRIIYPSFFGKLMIKIERAYRRVISWC